MMTELAKEYTHSSTNRKCSSAITLADKEGVLKPLLLTDLPLVLPIREYSIIPIVNAYDFPQRKSVSYLFQASDGQLFLYLS